MNISDWPISKTMQLPDDCFGQRWPVILGKQAKTAVTGYGISVAGLPEHMVVWQVLMFSLGAIADVIQVEAYMGDQLPTTDAEFYAMEPMFHDVISHTGRFSHFFFSAVSVPNIVMMKTYVHTMGRRLVTRVVHTNAGFQAVQFGLVISSIPKSVPECYDF